MTSFKYMGEFKDESSLPTRVQKGAVMFKEPDAEKFAIIANILSVVLLVLFLLLTFFYAGRHYNTWGAVVAFLLLVPHEFLHAIWMKGKVYMYTDWKKMMLFVTSTEDITKGRFIWMSLFPTLCFGFVPFGGFIINPDWIFLGYLGAFSIAMGAGDYCNIFLALTQMPKGSVTFLSGTHSYWYVPEK